MFPMWEQAFVQTTEAIVTPTLDQTAEQQALDEAGGDASRAIEILTRSILADEVRIAELLPNLVHNWAASRIGAELANRRRAIFAAQAQHRIEIESPRIAPDLRRAARNERLRLLDTPIWGGKRLADATPAELRESARQYSEKSTDMARKARWQNAIADAAAKKGNGPVGAHLSEDAVAKLWEKANV